MDRKKIISRIKSLRKSQKITAEKMAENMGFTAGAYRKFERGEVKVNEEYIEKISKILKVPEVELLFGNYRGDYLKTVEEPSESYMVMHSTMRESESKLESKNREIELLKSIIADKETMIHYLQDQLKSKAEN